MSTDALRRSVLTAILDDHLRRCFYGVRIALCQVGQEPIICTKDETPLSRSLQQPTPEQAAEQVWGAFLKAFSQSEVGILRAGNDALIFGPVSPGAVLLLQVTPFPNLGVGAGVARRVIAEVQEVLGRDVLH